MTMYTEYILPKPKSEPPRCHWRWFDKPYWRLLRRGARELDQHNTRMQAARDAKKAEVS